MVSYARLAVLMTVLVWLVAQANDESMIWVLEEYGTEAGRAALWLIRLATGGI